MDTQFTWDNAHETLMKMLPREQSQWAPPHGHYDTCILLCVCLQQNAWLFTATLCGKKIMADDLTF